MLRLLLFAYFLISESYRKAVLPIPVANEDSERLVKTNSHYKGPSRKADLQQILDSIVVSIPACHAGDRGSIPRRGDG